MMNPFHSPWRAESGVSGPEEFVGRLLEPYVHVGEVRGGDTVSAGHISVDGDNWHETVTDACRHAAFIVILPIMGSDPNGEIRGQAMLWELQYLAQSGALARTAVIMPANPYSRNRAIPAGWEHSRGLATAFGVQLPPYDKRGGILIMEQRDGAWHVLDIYGSDGPLKTRLARGLIEALRFVAKRDGVKLLDTAAVLPA